MRIILLLLGLLNVGVVAAQIIDNERFQFMSDEPFFDKDYIQQHQIKKITGHFSVKADMDRIRKSDRIYEYKFDRKGRLTSKWTTFYHDGQLNDTTITLYNYDSNGRLKIIKKADQFGYYSYHYTYNDSGDVIFEEFRRDLKNRYIKSDFNLNENFQVYAEKSTYEYFEGQTKRTYYNDEGKPYQYKIIYYNDKGQVREEYTQLIVNTGHRTVKYEYDESHRPSKKTIQSNMMTPIKKEFEYSYDEDGKLIEHHFFKNDNHHTEIQVVYSWKTDELKAFLTKKLNTNYIAILEFDFEHYD